MNFGILMTTGVSFEGYRITSYCGVISKEVVFRNGVGRSLDGNLRMRSGKKEQMLF